MAQITESDIQRCYKLGRDFAKGMVDFDEAVEEASSIGMNRASASDYVRNVKYMNEGFAYKRTISARATDYYLSKFQQDFGPEGLSRALAAVAGHIEYYENLQGVTLHKQREILDRFLTSGVSKKQAEKSSNEDFEDLVAKSIGDPRDVRLARIAAANPVPKEVAVASRTFVRNPDVAAEVLLRSRGNCEQCGQRAPFLRKANNKPYLEVHHRTPLAEGGHDTIENALALCPNCHREAHFGAEWKKYRS